MKKILCLKLFVIFALVSACHDDDVKFVNEIDSLPISKTFEFKMDESEGSTTIESVTNSSFEILGKGINRMAGVENNALFFDGISNEVLGSLSSSQLPSKQLVVSLWASPKSYPVGNGAMLALTQQGSSTGVMVGLNKFGQIVVQYFIEGAFAQQITENVLPRNSWSHIMVGINPANQDIKIYLNKTLIKDENIPAGQISWPSGNTPLNLGKNTMGEMMGIYDIDYFSGGLDEVQIYSGQATQEVVNFINEQYTAPTEVVYELDNDYTNDFNRPIFHPIPDYGWANESYGLVMNDGVYHMFYQKNDVFLGIAQQNWGHFTSSDLVHWKEENAVLWPEQGWDQEGIWSGDAFILQDGTPAAIYTGVDGIKAGIGIATSTNNYQSLDKDQINPVIPEAPSDVDLDFRDPYVWFENGNYHMIIGSGISNVGGNVVYYSSTDFKNWTYGGIAYQGQASKGEGQFWEMPVMHKFPNGKYMLLVQKTPDATPAITTYWIGDFVNGKFIPDNKEAKKLEVVNGFLSPAIGLDENNRMSAIGIIPDEVKSEFQSEQGWANLFSLPQVWDLDADDHIVIQPHPNLLALRGDDRYEFKDLNISEGDSNLLNDLNSRHFEMEGTINIGTANQVGFVFGKSPDGQEEYKVYYDVLTQEWVLDASKSSLSTLVRKDIRKGAYAIAPGSDVNVRVFVDGSVLEVFINNKSHFTGRFYPTLQTATGVDVFTVGGDATANLTIYKINK